MQITTLEQLSKVEVNHTLFLINPFGNSNQSKVEIAKFTVHAVCSDKLVGRKEFKRLGIDRVSDAHFIDLLSRCKYVYKLESEAETKLKEIHKGLHAFEVADHHSSCRESWNFYMNGV